MAESWRISEADRHLTPSIAAQKSYIHCGTNESIPQTRKLYKPAGTARWGGVMGFLGAIKRMELSFSLAGAVVGFLVGMTGVGGGSLMAPILILAFGFAPTAAVGTDLWFAAITKSCGGAMHRKFGSPDWTIIGRLAAGSVPAAILTVIWLHSRAGGKFESVFLLRLLGIALLVTAAITPFRKSIRKPLLHVRNALGPGVRRHQLAITVAAGAVVGSLVTLTSVGAGAIVALILTVLYPLRLNTRSLVGTDIVHAIPLAFVAALGHLWLGNVDWRVLASLLIGSIPGIALGSVMTGRINEAIIRNLLAVMLALSGFKLLQS